jgi:hypothetical protein
VSLLPFSFGTGVMLISSQTFDMQRPRARIGESSGSSC